MGTKRIKKTKRKGKKMKGGETSEFFVPDRCSPRKDGLGFTCLDEETLKDVASKVLKDHSKKQVSDHNLEDVYELMKEKLKNEHDCQTEACLLKKTLLSTQKKKKLYRNELPKDVVEDKTAWLSNYDIDGVMKQLEASYPEFEYYEATPIDFDKCSVNRDLCKLTLSGLKKNKKCKVGIIFNTDDSSGEGRHWIALYIDMDGLNSNGKPGMYYIDSFANTMPAQIDELIKKFSGESEDVLGDTMTLAHNKRSFQKNNYACGYYCMHFIEHMIQGNSFADYKALPPTDKMMEEYSLQCFIHPDMMV